MIEAADRWEKLGATRPQESDEVRLQLFRSLRLAVAGFVGIIVATVSLIALLSWRNERRLTELQAHVVGTQMLQADYLGLERIAIDRLAAGGALSTEARAALRTEIDRLADPGVHIDPKTRGRLHEARRLLDEPGPVTKRSLSRMLRLFHAAAVSEATARQEVLDAMTRDLRVELRLALTAPVVLLGLGGVILWGTRRRIYQPLQSLESLLSQVADGRFDAVSLQGVEPILLPLFRNYNSLVRRLRELEHEHRVHAESLEREVRLATGALLEQQQSLARAERLAATGELAATVAHELRNPLAAILVALRNLRHDVGEPDLVQRLALVSEEVERLSRLINETLNLSRHEPEPARELRLADVVRQLAELTRYQLPPETELDVQIPEELVCFLPADSLRQSLLNLILNASEAFPQGRGRIVVRAGREDETLRLEVVDDGPGFSPEVLEQAARPFFSTREHGTGLGLSMVSRFARDLGGRLALENAENGGAKVTLLLPHRVNARE
jgi:signal transduction histidine kinase